IDEAAKLARVNRAAISDALDHRELMAFFDPTARRLRKQVRIRRSQVIARWVEKPSPLELVERWEVFEHRMRGGNHVVVAFNGRIVNQWVTHFGKTKILSGHQFYVAGTEHHEPLEGNPEWVDQPTNILNGKYFRQVRSPEKIHDHLYMNVYLGGGKTP